MAQYNPSRIQGDTVIVDVDGTIANCEHRMHYIKVKPKNWPAFIEASKYDEPYHEIVLLVMLLSHQFKIVIVTARSEAERQITVDWLRDFAKLGGFYDKLYMRDDKDYRKDDIVKHELLQQIRNDGFDPFMALEDRDHVVAMWRQNGLRCLQVNEEKKWE